MGEVLRTPDEAFAELPDFPYEPRYADDLPGYEGLRLAWIDEGPEDAGEVFVCLHGQPTWSFLYRKMIAVFVAAGQRVVAPDLFGFGRSDKPGDDAVYTFDFHRATLLAFLDRLGVAGATLVCHDWGGLLGLTLPVDRPDAFSRLIVTNTGLATGLVPIGDGFLEWKAWAASHPDMDVARLMKRATPHLTDAEAAAYGAPFPDVRYKAGVRRFPQIVPLERDDPGAEVSRRALAWWKKRWSGPSFMAIGQRDPVLGPPAMRLLHRMIPGCPEPLLLVDAGHFVPEWGDQVARAALASFG